MQDPKCLSLNSSLVNDNNGSYQAMQTTIHEGRHAYQDDCIRGRIKPQPQDRGKVEVWAYNSSALGGVYYGSSDNSFTDYRYQPKEADANNFANAKMNSFSNEFFQDQSYSYFTTKRDYENLYTEAIAKSTYGENYEQAVQGRVESDYQVKSIGPNAPNNNNGGKGNMFNFKKDKDQREQSAQKPSQGASQQSNQDKAKAFRQSLKVDVSKQQPSTKQSSAQSSSSSQSSAPSIGQRERGRAPQVPEQSKYKASAKSASASKSQSQSKGGQER